MLDAEPLLLSAALLWLFVVGSTVGSFLNVVVYRMPAGLSLLFPSSHCPACKTPIRLRDNVPIFGWLLLRGKCRDCGVQISARYPLVELATALIFVVLAWFEPLAGAMNLPWVGFLRAQPAVGQHNLTVVNLWSMYAFHLFLLCSLLTAALIEYDGHRLPHRLLTATLLVGLVAPIIWPWLRPVSMMFSYDPFITKLWLRWYCAIGDGLWGMMLGSLVALLIWQAEQRCTTLHKVPWKTGRFRSVAVLLWAGVFLGGRGCLFPAAVTSAIFLCAVALARHWPELERIPWSCWFGLVVLVWLINWRRFDAWLPERTSGANSGWFVATLATIGGLSWLAAKIRIGNFHRRCGM